jgi:hypothetical protein
MEKSASSEPVTEREMWGRSLDRGFSIIWRVFLAFGSPPSCPGSTLFAFDRDPEHPTAVTVVGGLSLSVNVSPPVTIMRTR